MRVLIVQRSLSPPGGGSAVAAWMVQALLDHHQVDTLTESTWSAADTNAFYGTSINDGEVTKHLAPFYWRAMSGLNEDRLTRLRMSALLGRARSLAPRYDLLITADNYAAFAKPGIQYVHFPAKLEPPPARLAPLVDRYFSLCNSVLGGKWTDAKRNVTLANSEWTAAGIAELGEFAKPQVLYPPVLDPGEGLPWLYRDNSFLVVGRFTPAKRIETVISIVRRVRAQALPGAKLVIIGSPVDSNYTSLIRGQAVHDGDWIEFREDLPRQALYEQMRRTRYGIHAMEREHFGMATAEMTRAGCLVFAHGSGGSTEVLNEEAALLWTSEDDAVERINAIAAQRLDSIDALRSRLRAHTAAFSTESFVRRFREIVGAQVS